MDNVVFRDARPEDAALIVQMIRYMVTDMAAYGGHPPAGEDLAWEKMQAARMSRTAAAMSPNPLRPMSGTP